MVQKEVKKKTSIYTIVAVLSAIVLVSMVYVLGSPGITPVSDISNNGAGNQPIALTEPTGIGGLIPIDQSTYGMKTFHSMDELRNYLNSTTTNMLPLPGEYWARPVDGSNSFAAPTASGVGMYGVTEDYSSTNIQVAGVDEADTVKTDGQYIYTISTTQPSGAHYYYGASSQANNNVYIVSADSQNPREMSRIHFDNDSTPKGLFLSPDSTRLIVIISKYQYQPYSQNGITIMPYYSSSYTSLYVYDVSDKANPVLARNFTVSGTYFNSRMIGNYLYAVTSQNAYIYQNVVPVPSVYTADNVYTAAPTTIYYADMNNTGSYSFTSFYGLDVSNDQQQPTSLTVLMSGASTMYVSQNNIYVTYPTWANRGSETSIYRVKISGLQLTFEAQGSVPGYTINQYALDEYNGNLRIVTNLNQYASTTSLQVNNVYVLNQNLTVIGKLEGLGNGENLHSVRFMGNRGYVVTFKKTDPLFVIDLSVPAQPKLLGELVIPGYSDYLHPYDETHLIGVGKEAVDAQQGDFAWYQGLKVALFDVSDVNNPVQVANYAIGDRGTDSAVLSDPKAFLFDKTKDLLVIPVNLAIINQTAVQQYPTGFPAYGDMVWQGAYVFSVSANGNFTLRGTVTHIDPSLLDSQGHLTNNNNVYNSQNEWITRSLFIGNTLYTISNSEVKLNSLSDLSQIATVNLT